MIRALDYTRRLTEPREDMRRVVHYLHPSEITKPDERGIYRWRGWRGVECKGRGMWQTEECWGKSIEDFPGEDWHVSRRDYCVDVETSAVPETWWREYFVGVRNRKILAAQPDGDPDKILETEGTGKSERSLKGNSEYVGSARSPCRLRLYVKYLRRGVAHKVRQEHLDTWASAGWSGGLVVRVEFETHRPAPMRLSVAAGWADCAARIRLCEERPDGRRGERIKTAARWSELGGVVKYEREKKAADAAMVALAKSVARLQKQYGVGALALAVLAGRVEKKA